MIARTSFKDHFSDQSQQYARYRPHYPEALFEFCAGLTEAHELAWDCATGSGQCALGLAPHYRQIIATDASAEQIDAATAHPSVRYRVARAEHSGLGRRSADLVTVGQALHWFDHGRFFTEAKRVLKPRGLLATWTYQLCRVSPEVDRVIDRLYHEITGPYWPPERDLVDSSYAAIEYPAPLLDVPPFEMRCRWSADDMLGYLGTWSASKRYAAAESRDPVGIIATDLQRTWGKGRREVVWPLTVNACFPAE